MRLRINGEYLNLSKDTDVIIERRSKLFEDLESLQRDFSYSFEFPATTKNLTILGFPFPDNSSKTIYNNIPCELIGNDGIPLYCGRLRVENVNKKITASFFSGNYNWLSMIDGDLQDLDWSAYDTDITQTAISNSRVLNSGLVFPLLDLGGLTTRAEQDLKAEDFAGTMYVKTIFQKIFYSKGIKFTGDLANDWLFNNTVVCKNNRSGEIIEANSCHVQKTATTNRPTENVDYKMTFDNETTGGYFDGDGDAFDLANSKYVAPYKMTVDVDCTLQGSAQDANYSNRIRIYINGAFTFVDVGLSVGGLYNTAVPGDQEFFSIRRTITLEEGDELEIYSHWQESTGSTTAINVLTGTLKITPVYIYFLPGKAAVPNWTSKDFVLNVLNLFNVIPDFDPVSKTVTFNLFEKLKTKEPIDISAYVDPDTVDINFSEIIQDYGRKNYLTYAEGDDEDLRKYNITESVKYGAGSINVDNDFIEPEATIIDSAFASPISYINPVLRCSLERLNLIDLQESEETDFTAVAVGTSGARFTVSAEFYLVDDLVRIKDSTDPALNGDWIVAAIGSGYIELSGAIFSETAVGKVCKLSHRYNENDNVFILVNARDQDVSEISDVLSFTLDGVDMFSIAYAYFNMLDTGDVVNANYLQGLSFGSVNNIKSFQKSLIDTYWRTVDRILNDPVRVKADFYFPTAVFRSLTPTRPVFLKTEHTSNMYYLNNITGYRSSHLPCAVELIKL